MEQLPSCESIPDYDYSDDSFEDIEEIQEIIDTTETKQPPLKVDIAEMDMTLPSESVYSAVDIIDTFILSQIEFLNQIKQIAIKNTINK